MSEPGRKEVSVPRDAVFRDVRPTIRSGQSLLRNFSRQIDFQQLTVSATRKTRISSNRSFWGNLINYEIKYCIRNSLIQLLNSIPSLISCSSIYYFAPQVLLLSKKCIHVSPPFSPNVSLRSLFASAASCVFYASVD